jgi:hypothetical protein
VVTEKHKLIVLTLPKKKVSVAMEMGDDSWEHHVTPLLMNCGQEDENNEEYLHHTAEVSDN